MHPSSAYGADKIEDRVDSGRESEPGSGEQDQAEGRNMLNEEQPEQARVYNEEAYSAVSTDEVHDINFWKFLLHKMQSLEALASVLHLLKNPFQ